MQLKAIVVCPTVNGVKMLSAYGTLETGDVPRSLLIENAMPNAIIESPTKSVKYRFASMRNEDLSFAIVLDPIAALLKPALSVSPARLYSNIMPLAKKGKGDLVDSQQSMGQGKEYSALSATPSHRGFCLSRPSTFNF